LPLSGAIKTNQLLSVVETIKKQRERDENYEAPVGELKLSYYIIDFYSINSSKSKYNYACVYLLTSILDI